MTEQEKAMVKKLTNESSGWWTSFSCYKALRSCNWNYDKAAKFLENYPYISYSCTDYWVNKEYLYCKKCDRFYLVPRNTRICNVCDGELEDNMHCM